MPLQGASYGKIQNSIVCQLSNTSGTSVLMGDPFSDTLQIQNTMDNEMHSFCPFKTSDDNRSYAPVAYGGLSEAHRRCCTYPPSASEGFRMVFMVEKMQLPLSLGNWK